MKLKTYKLKEATNTMLDEVNEIYLKCRSHLFQNGIFQWDDHYPNREYFQECIEYKALYVLMDGTEMIGHVVLNEWESLEWQVIPWKESKPIIIHSLMIDPQLQGKGIGTEFVKHCEELAISKGYKSIRLDAFSGNEKAIQLYHKLGYQKRGSVSFRSKPEGHQEYIRFEKIL